MPRSDPIRLLELGLDQGALKSLLLDAIAETGMNLRRLPTKDEVLDFLFSENRQDPEALYLARRISPMIIRCLNGRKTAVRRNPHDRENGALM